MCDDYFDDDSGECGESENCSDDLLDEPFDEEADCDECEDFEETDERDVDDSEPAEDEVLPTFDMADAIILGSMIAGNAYEEAADRENRLKLLNSKSGK